MKTAKKPIAKKSVGKAAVEDEKKAPIRKDDEDTDDSTTSDDTIENVDLNESQSDDRSLKEIQNEERDEPIKEISEKKEDNQKKEAADLRADKPKLIKEEKSLSESADRKDELENDSENVKQEKSKDPKNAEKIVEKKEPAAEKVDDGKADAKAVKRQENRPSETKNELQVEQTEKKEEKTTEIPEKPTPVSKAPANKPLGQQKIVSVVDLLKVKPAPVTGKVPANSDPTPKPASSNKATCKPAVGSQPQEKPARTSAPLTPSVQILINKPIVTLSTGSTLTSTVTTQAKTTAFFPLPTGSTNKVCLPQVKPINVSQSRLNDRNHTSQPTLSKGISASNLTKQLDTIRVTRPSLSSLSSLSTGSPQVTPPASQTTINKVSPPTSEGNVLTNFASKPPSGQQTFVTIAKPIPIHHTNKLMMSSPSLSSNLLTINSHYTPLSIASVSSPPVSSSSGSSFTVTSQPSGGKLVNVRQTFTPIVSPVVNLNQVSPNLVKNNLTNLSSPSLEKIKVPSFIKQSTAPAKPSSIGLPSIPALVKPIGKAKDEPKTVKSNLQPAVAEKALVPKAPTPKAPVPKVQSENENCSNGKEENKAINGQVHVPQVPQLSNFKQTSTAILQAKQRNIRRVSPPPIFWQKHNHLIDQVVITDVKSDDVSITIRESKSPKDFFRPSKSATKKKKGLNKLKQMNGSVSSKSGQT